MTALWSLIAVAVAGSIAVVTNSEVGPGFALVALLGWIVLLPLIRPVGGVRRLSDVAFLAGCVFFLTFGLRSVLLLVRAQPELPLTVPDLAVQGALAGFLPIHFDALLLALVCWVAFTIGYRSPFGSAAVSHIGDPDLERLSTSRLAFVTCLLAGVGWAARLAFRAIHPTFGTDPGVLVSDDTIFTAVGSLAPTALVLALLGVVRFPRHPTFIVLAAGLTLAETGFALIVGVRLPLFAVALAIAAFGVVRTAKPGRWLLLVILPLALMVFGATAVYRTPQVFSEFRTDDAFSRITTTLDKVVELGPVGIAEVGLWNVSSRYIGVDSVAQVLLVGAPEPTWGERYLLAIPSAVIPRALWKDKPDADYVFEFAYRYHDIPTTVAVPFAPTWVADLLLSFPLLFVPVAMVVLGLACRVLNDYGRRAQARRSFGLVPFALVLPYFVQSDAWITGSIYQLTQILAITFGVALLLGVGLTQRSRPPTTTSLGRPLPATLARVRHWQSPGGAS